MSLFDYTVKTVDGKEYDLADYKDKVLLIVNTASEWGFKSQLGGLQELYEKYNDKGLMIFGFPCNQFKGQEPLEGMEILKHYKDQFDISFPISVKIEVNGSNTDPLYRFLKKKAPYNGFGSFKEKAILYPILKSSYPKYLEDNELRWNYTKFLVAKGGEIVERFEPSVKPKKIEKRIKELLEL